MSRSPRLSRALAVSAAVHLALLGGLLALARPRLAVGPAMRVALVGTGTATGASTASGSPVERVSPAGALGTAAPARRAPSGSIDGPARRPGHGASADEPGGTASAAAALVTAVQSDVWVLGAPAGEERAVAPRPAAPAAAPPVAGALRRQDEASREGGGATPGRDGPGEGAGVTGGDGTAAVGAAVAAGAGGQGPGTPGTDGASSASLLAALSQRLAWSAERCAPASVVRTARHSIPGVPLHFCLDAAGRPSQVGLLGTTGSDPLDRAARDCVVQGALPLPPVPGCYTVEVRFPIRG